MEISIDVLKKIDLFRDIELKKVPAELEEARINEFLPGDIILSPEKENRNIFFCCRDNWAFTWKAPIPGCSEPYSSDIDDGFAF